MRPRSSPWLLLTCALAMLPAGEALAASAPSWEEVPPMITPRGRHTATVLQDGRVLVIGGNTVTGESRTWGAFIQDVEIYDPASKTWAPAAPLGTLPRSRVATAFLPNGDVLATDGLFVQAYAPSLDTWSALPPLPYAVWNPSAVVLPSGKVLVIGVILNSWSALTGSIYDPAAGSWTTIRAPGSMLRGYVVTAALLDDGRVIVETTTRSSIYDPEANAWTQTADLVAMHGDDHRTTLLPGGDLLVVGGSGELSALEQFRVVSEVYLHRSNLWVMTSSDYPFPEPGCAVGLEEGMSTSLLPSGRVLMTSGMYTYDCYFEGGPLNPYASPHWYLNQIIFPGQASAYDPALLGWVDLPRPSGTALETSLWRVYHSSTLLGDGSVLITGGYVRGEPVAGHDNTTDTILPTASALLFHELSPRGAACEADGDCASGFCADSVCCDAACAGPCEACAAAAGAAQDGVCTPLTGTACDDADACLVGGVCEAGRCAGGAPAPDGTACRAGEMCSAASACVGGACVGTAEVTCPPPDGCHEAPACDAAAGCAGPAAEKADGTRCDVPGTPGAWHNARPMLAPLYSPAAARLRDGTVLALGHGRLTRDEALHPLAMRHDPRTNRWQATGPVNMPNPIWTAPALVPLQDGTALLVGNEAHSERFDPETGAWTPAAAMLQRRSGHTATPLQDGRVLVAGGHEDRTAELYDPVSDTWTQAAPMSVVRRSRHTATLLQDGRVLVAGDGAAEVYSPDTDTWTAAAGMSGMSLSPSAASPLSDGRVLFLSDSTETAVVYDPVSDTRITTGRMIAVRNQPSAVLLPDGRVLVTGGLLPGGVPVGSGVPVEHAVEIYDPASNTWSQAAPPDLLLSNHTATVLEDGRVLIAGGDPGHLSFPIAHAWFFVPGQRPARGVCQDGACAPGGEGEGGAGGGGGEAVSSASAGAGGDGGGGGGEVASSTSSAGSGGAGGDGGSGGEAASSVSAATGGGSGGATGTGASTTGAAGAQSGGGDGPSDGGGCRMTPAGQGAAPWILVLGALAAARLRRRSPRGPIARGSSAAAGAGRGPGQARGTRRRAMERSRLRHG
ncbi:kelch repeat-containing protein [Sorangium sp. So ce854]|uniref:kelch repeat-containing protein n=1 Tax=Sorangium sp. So ce854 TaxID=3133322 RepID=UPI003F628876